MRRVAMRVARLPRVPPQPHRTSLARCRWRGMELAGVVFRFEHATYLTAIHTAHATYKGESEPAGAAGYRGRGNSTYINPVYSSVL